MAMQRILLSGSTSGKPIKVVQTATAGTLIHTATSDATEMDAVYLWAANTSGSAATLTMEWGGATDPADLLTKSYSIGANSAPTVIANGQPLTGGMVVRAFSGTANVLTITGYANRITR